MRIYISGPITGIPGQNRENFKKAQEIIESKGHEAVNPLDISDKMDAGLAWIEYLLPCLDALSECDAYTMFDRWAYSDGVRIERSFAMHLGIPYSNIALI